ncbi:PAS domain S-box protein [Natronomonas halophila]|uniref:bacterio-opsin activator domain-containing protein n=1 Tax=Natronomonas halophila TaxID=2747817 RepID=UPI0015B4890E|nr:bacterio-opsin activator domain-containing protein [Natronomonas halophila]QLD85182.1 PAS domain S-box protein [Natronomonas halophila]
MAEIDLDELTATLLESVPDMAYIVDADARLAWWNDRVREVTGYAADELAGRDVFELIAPDQREDLAASFGAVGTFEPTETREFDVLTADGERIPHEFNGTTLTSNGETYVVGIARDVSDRRERETAIRRQRDELETLNRISETVHEVIQAVVDAATRAEIEDAVCERLAASELYRSVWIARDGPGDVAKPDTGVGTIEDFLEVVDEINTLDWDRPAQVAIETGEAQVVQRISEADIPETARTAAARMNIESGTAVPIVHQSTVLGVLCVYSSRPEAFSDREQAAFRRLGEVIGFAINAVQTERLLMSDTAMELTLRVSGSDAFLARVSEESDGPCQQEWSTPMSAGRYRHYVTVSGIDPERVEAIAEGVPTVESIDHVGGTDGDHVFTVVTTDSLVQRFVENGASPASLVARDGETTIVAELPSDADPRPIVEAAKDLYGAELVSKREVERSVRTAEEFYDTVADCLTERQQAALRHASLGGYFAWPRDATAEEIAEVMGISSATFHYHIRRAQQALVEAYFQHLDG